MKLLVDGDVLCYRAAFATEKTRYLVMQCSGSAEVFRYFDDAKAAKADTLTGSVLWSRKELEPEDKAVMLVDVMLRDIFDHYAAESPTVHIYLSGVGNFRHSIATRATYKGNRSGTPTPTHLKAIRQHLCSKHGAISSAGEEADDLLGIAMTSYPDSVLCSIDKDLMQLPGRHYDFVKKEEVTVTPKQAVINFYAQVLSGDSTDNVPGLPGIGPVKARKALDGCRNPAECWRVALNLYSGEFGLVNGPKYATECAQLVHVRRTPGEIWSPPIAKTTKTEEQPYAKTGS